MQVSVPDVATTDPFRMSKALRTGGKVEPDIFIRMFEDIISDLEGRWAEMGVGFELKNTGVRMTTLLWVDNFDICAGFESVRFHG